MKSRYPKFILGPNGEKLCRGCGKPVPKYRQTWCSTECYNTRCPQEVIRRLFQRDKGICCLCGRDTEMLRRAYRRMVQRVNYSPYYHYSYEFTKPAEKLRNARKKAGFPNYGRWWHADHIIPFSEGGETILENMRTLCVPCHKQRTKHWHKKRKAISQLIHQPDLPPITQAGKSYDP